MEWLILVPVMGITVALWVLVNRGRRGPSRCMGCGKCDKAGVCVLTGKAVGGQPCVPKKQ